MTLAPSLPSGGLSPRIRATAASRLPVWPVVVMFGFFPLWWVLGLVDVMWMPVAAVMALYLQRSRAVQAPRKFGVWLLFLVFSGGSVIMITNTGDMIGFLYRYAIYLSCTVLFIYVYNARRTLTSRFVSGVLTCWWLTTVAGGYLGLLLPTVVIRTPASYLISSDLRANELVNHMVIRRFAQYNPDSFFANGPRPSAPFLYTNNWGNVFSLLLPFVIVYMFHVRGQVRFRLLVLALMASAVPAALTLNRGMFLGIGVAAVYVALRLTLRRDPRGIAALALLGVVGVVAFQLLPVQAGLDSRLSGDGNSNTARSSLYVQALQLVPKSPVFGFGGPQPSFSEDAPVGTQGQFWQILVSHGPIAASLFVGFFLLCFWRIRKRQDPTGIACATVLLVGTMELAYYGVVPNGLPLMLIAAAIGLRDQGDVAR